MKSMQKLMVEAGEEGADQIEEEPAIIEEVKQEEEEEKKSPIPVELINQSSNGSSNGQ